jgi:hypothetical protein
MDQLLKMAADAGMTKEQGKAASGGIFSLVKKTLDSGDYNKILQKIPEIKGVVVSNHEESTKNAAASRVSLSVSLLVSRLSVCLSVFSHAVRSFAFFSLLRDKISDVFL